MVVLDRFFKMAHFIPCNKAFDATNVVDLYFQEIIRLYGIFVIFDQDSKFAGHFWRTLWRKFETQLQFSAIVHLQTDGRTEVINRIFGKSCTKLYRQEHLTM